MESQQLPRPWALTPMVVLLVFVDLLSFVDVPQFFSRECAFYFAFSLFMVPIYWGLYQGKGWSRSLLIVASLLALVSAALNGASIYSQYSPFRFSIFIVELVVQIAFLSFAFLPSVRLYFAQSIIPIHLVGEWVVAPIWKRSFALLFDMGIALLLFFPLYYFAMKLNFEWGKFLAGLLSLSFLIFVPYTRFSPIGLILGVRLVNLVDRKAWPFFAIMRFMYGALLFPLNIFFVLFDPYSQGVHDHICSTVIVVKK